MKLLLALATISTVSAAVCPHVTCELKWDNAKHTGNTAKPHHTVVKHLPKFFGAIKHTCIHNRSTNKCTCTCDVPPTHRHVIVGNTLDWQARHATNANKDKGEMCHNDLKQNGPVSNEYGNKMGVTCCNSNGKGSRPGCASSKNFAEAKSHCEARGLRLCTPTEIRNGAGRGTGCNFDAYHVWTSATCSCAGGTDSCKLPSTSHMAVVGNTANFVAHSSGNKPAKCFDDNQLRGTPYKNSYGNRMGTTCCNSKGQGSRPGCAAGQSFLTAKAHCETRGLRLCTQSEIQKGAGRGTGCNFDAYHVWTSTPCSLGKK